MMTTLTDRYFNTLIERLAKVRDEQAASIGKAAEMCAISIAAGKLAFTFGTGHGALPALESFPRTGTIVGFRPIVESTMISFHHVWGDMGARQYRFIHAQEGYGKAILKSHQLDDADTMILFSHSGINAVIMDLAMECKARGIGQFARGHARRGQEGRRLAIAERDGAGLVQQQHVHVARGFDGAARGGDDVGAHHPAHARHADGGQQAADGGGDQADEQGDQHRHGDGGAAAGGGHGV